MSTSMTPPDFAALGAHATLAKALATRGYEQPTAVQAAVLAAAEVDLLVSSQTGSGKTVAFGLVVGKLLLGEHDALPLSAHGKPRALVIAPTRELATQVQRELEWLFAPAKLKVISCTGGTDLRNDARNLKRGVDVVVGTPGRLVDLVERRSLDLGSVEVVVLDEADEMLDLGFRESLETLLTAAPVERRTLLFSATLPVAIRSLAERYQKSALRIDPRGATGKRVAAHDDIRHLAYLVARGERLAALSNLLRLYEEERSIVFCRTREAVSTLERQLAQRGFSVAAIAGDRAQADRSSALDALRSGRAQVLVATNVAARGLDLPEVALVAHADLPENAESLTHRSGRTGRAGKKGTSVLIVEVAERRKAERLLAEARLPIAWSAPPSAADVAEKNRHRVAVQVGTAIAATQEAVVDPSVTALAEELVAEHSPAKVVTALLQRLFAERRAGDALTPVDLSPPRPKRDAPTGRAALSPLASGGSPSGNWVLFEVSAGARERAEPGWILPLVCARGGYHAPRGGQHSRRPRPHARRNRRSRGRRIRGARRRARPPGPAHPHHARPSTPRRRRDRWARLRPTAHATAHDARPRPRQDHPRSRRTAPPAPLQHALRRVCSVENSERTD